jgi:hypothetical protein
LAGAIAAPLQAFAGLLQALPRNLAYGLQALIDQQGGVPETAAPEAAPEAEAATPEAAAPEAEAATPEAAAPEAEAATPEAAADEAPSPDAGEPPVETEPEPETQEEQ